MKKSSMFLFAFFAALAVAVLVGFQVRAKGQQHKEPIGYEDTPMLPGLPFHVHDPKRPHPPVVTPAAPPSIPSSTASVRN